ncbi:hypothetical protein [Microcoleus asticus]|uniref:Uncharacterized protein n=1 Tax=Microcoleus asticus IPMA8 TaxID=2563858 RepID=A0ABX2D272_9CYAN|nr:hypothetical protein [Microcoleus asticus]NQE36746.1 hypothetical protein [Microcoleus asticus IPMA8]
MIEPEDQAEYQKFRQEMLEIFKKAQNISIRDFAVEILTGAIMDEKPYVAIASMMIEHSTPLRGEEKRLVLERFLEEGRKKDGDTSLIEAALKLIADGLIIHYQQAVVAEPN